MIDYTKVRRDIETYLNENLTTLPIIFENTLLDSEDQEHVEMVDTDVAAQPMGMGDPSKMVTGLLTMMIKTEVGSGTEKARACASEIITLLESFPSSINFAESIFNSIGLLEGQSLYQHNLSIPYTYIYGQDDSNAC